jgi:hypothetical protein
VEGIWKQSRIESGFWDYIFVKKLPTYRKQGV